VLVRAPGTGDGRTLLLCAHVDTVNVEGMTDPHAPRVDGDLLYGRGAYDMKAGVAAALIAAREAARLGLAGDVVVAAVADEEHASLGVQEALRALHADAAIVTEPTELEIAVAHKGFVWSEVRVTGRAARPREERCHPAQQRGSASTLERVTRRRPVGTEASMREVRAATPVPMWVAARNGARSASRYTGFRSIAARASSSSPWRRAFSSRIRSVYGSRSAPSSGKYS